MVLETGLETAVAKRDDLPNVDDVYDRDEEIPITEVFDTTFVQTYTDFESFDELVAASPADADAAADLERVGDGDWDEFAAERTEFDDEATLVMAARDHWVATRLDLV